MNAKLFLALADLTSWMPQANCRDSAPSGKSAPRKASHLSPPRLPSADFSDLRQAPRALVHVSWGFIPAGRRLSLMDLGYRNILAPDGPHYSVPTTDFRSPTLPRPPAVDFMQRSSESCEMENPPPVTGKRRGGCRKACNECKQQKVSHLHVSHYSSPRVPTGADFAILYS